MRSYGMYDASRGLTLALAAALAGLGLWGATQIGMQTTGRFWLSMAVVAGAGLLIALANHVGTWTKGLRLRMSPGTFALAFLPVLVVGGWILVATQPGNGWEEGRLHSWSNSIGVLGVVHSIGLWHGVLAFAIGLILGLSLDGVPAPVEEEAAPGVRTDRTRSGRAGCSRAPLRGQAHGDDSARDGSRRRDGTDADANPVSLTGKIDPRPPLERVMWPRIPAGRDHADGVGPPIHRTEMNVFAQETTRRGEQLLVAHLRSLDPRAVPARERLEETPRARARAQARLRARAARVRPPSGLATYGRRRGRRTGVSPRRRTRSQIAANETRASTIAVAPLSPMAMSPK